VQICVFADSSEMARAAAGFASSSIRRCLEGQNRVVLVAATGTSQIAFLENLTGDRSIDWSRVELFHLDEYVGLGIEHPASFARYVRDRLILPAGIRYFHLLDGAREASEVVAEANAAISSRKVDIAFVGIGENAHLAFNDPPADFETEAPYIIVDLDERCRLQQVNEGWFAGIDEVPRRAISMSVRQILKADQIIVVVPDLRKGLAVKAAIEGPVVSAVPASILQRHGNVSIFLDEDSASMLEGAAVRPSEEA
jgi:glucosamine-6-phosphate deaminase